MAPEDGGDEEEGIADRCTMPSRTTPPGQSEQEILERFGERVHRIVMGCTLLNRRVTAKAPRKERKRRFIDHLRREAHADVLRWPPPIYNARSIINDMRVVGEDVWSRFSVPREKNLGIIVR